MTTSFYLHLGIRFIQKSAEDFERKKHNQNFQRR